MVDPAQASLLPELKSAERLKFFTDAVVAIALTLLVLPLVEAVSEAAQHQQTTIEILRTHDSQIFSFLLSFAVVASFWISHHHIFEHVSRYTPALMTLNFMWMFTVVFLQFPTALVGALPTDPLQLALYIGVMALSSLLLSVITWLVARTPELRFGLPPFEVSVLASTFSITALFILVLVIVVVVPGVSYYALLLLFLRLPLRRWMTPHVVGVQR